MSVDAAALSALGAVASGILLGLAAVVAAARKRESDNDERLLAEIVALRKYTNSLAAALAKGNRRLIKSGLSPEDVPEEFP